MRKIILAFLLSFCLFSSVGLLGCVNNSNNNLGNEIVEPSEPPNNDSSNTPDDSETNDTENTGNPEEPENPEDSEKPDIPEIPDAPEEPDNTEDSENSGDLEPPTEAISQEYANEIVSILQEMLDCFGYCLEDDNISIEFKNSICSLTFNFDETILLEIGLEAADLLQLFEESLFEFSDIEFSADMENYPIVNILIKKPG